MSAQDALREIAEMAPPMPSKSAAVSQCFYLKEIARRALAELSPENSKAAGTPAKSAPTASTEGA